jgi:hypothetical protein
MSTAIAFLIPFVAVMAIAVAVFGRSLMKYVDLLWARSYLDAVVSHAEHALIGAVLAYRENLDDARSDGSAGGNDITDDEYRAAREAALDALIDAVSMGKLSKALTHTRGTKSSHDDARAFMATIMDRAISRPDQ